MTWGGRFKVRMWSCEGRRPTLESPTVMRVALSPKKGAEHKKKSEDTYYADEDGGEHAEDGTGRSRRKRDGGGWLGRTAWATDQRGEVKWVGACA